MKNYQTVVKVKGQIVAAENATSKHGAWQIASRVVKEFHKAHGFTFVGNHESGIKGRLKGRTATVIEIQSYLVNANSVRRIDDNELISLNPAAFGYRAGGFPGIPLVYGNQTTAEGFFDSHGTLHYWGGGREQGVAVVDEIDPAPSADVDTDDDDDTPGGGAEAPLFDEAPALGAPTEKACTDALGQDPESQWLAMELIIPRTARTLCYGPPSTGKTHIGFEVARICGDSNPCKVNMTDQTPAAELRGHFVPKGQEWFFMHASPLVKFEHGGVLIIDEIDEGGADAQAFLAAILDDATVATITLPNGTQVRRHRDFRVIACMNGHPSDLHPRLVSRFPVKFYVDTPNPKAIAALPGDLREAARKLTVAKDEKARVDLRSWFAFADLRSKLGHERLAARGVFGPRAGDVLAAIRAAADKTITQTLAGKTPEGYIALGSITPVAGRKMGHTLQVKERTQVRIDGIVYTCEPGETYVVRPEVARAVQGGLGADKVVISKSLTEVSS